MPRMSLQDEIRAAFREVLLPEIRALHADFQDIRAEIALMRAATGPLRSIVLAGLQRLEARLEAMERGVRRPSPCFRASPRCRPARRRS
jgi:hypothetical protein